MILGARISTLFPYTTLFRSAMGKAVGVGTHDRDAGKLGQQRRRLFGDHEVAARGDRRVRSEPRSEEHTSELQSREKLVCRLLLEKTTLGILVANLDLVSSII